MQFMIFSRNSEQFCVTATSRNCVCMCVCACVCVFVCMCVQYYEARRRMLSDKAADKDKGQKFKKQHCMLLKPRCFSFMYLKARQILKQKTQESLCFADICIYCLYGMRRIASGIKNRTSIRRPQPWDKLFELNLREFQWGLTGRGII